MPRSTYHAAFPVHIVVPGIALNRNASIPLCLFLFSLQKYPFAIVSHQEFTIHVLASSFRICAPRENKLTNDSRELSQEREKRHSPKAVMKEIIAVTLHD